MGRRMLISLLVLAFGAAACGARVSDKQVTAEAREDARRAGLTGGLALGSGGDVLGGEAASGDQGTAVGPGGAAGAGGATGAAGGAAAGRARSGPGGNVGAAAPAGGNGGATDVGVTGDEIKWGWVGTLTGPVPGLFRGALIGTQAYAAYVNSQGGLFGRRIKVLPGDDGLDSGKNRAACLQLKDQIFSFVGSFSINDDGCNPVLQQCKCPDVGAALNLDHLAIPTTFSPQPQAKGWRTGAFNYFKQHYPKEVIEHVAFFSAGVASARPIAAWERQVMESMGYKIVAGREIQPGEQNFTSDVIQMRQRGARMVTMQGDAATMARISAEMEAQNFKVDLQDWGGSIYDYNSFKIAGKTALEGDLTDQTFAMFLGQDAKFVPEINTFKQWMAKIDPNQPVDLFSFYGWLAGKLWTEAAKGVGPQLTRAKIVDTLSKIGTWDGGGLVAPVNIGQKRPSDCVFIFRIKNGDFVREFPTDKLYDCSLGPFKPV